MIAPKEYTSINDDVNKATFASFAGKFNDNIVGIIDSIDFVGIVRNIDFDHNDQAYENAGDQVAHG